MPAPGWLESAELGFLGGPEGGQNARRGGASSAIADAALRSGAEARRRLTAALADVSGSAAQTALVSLADDPDRGVALTARYLLHVRQQE